MKKSLTVMLFIWVLLFCNVAQSYAWESVNLLPVPVVGSSNIFLMGNSGYSSDEQVETHEVIIVDHSDFSVDKVGMVEYQIERVSNSLVNQIFSVSTVIVAPKPGNKANAFVMRQSSTTNSEGAAIPVFHKIILYVNKQQIIVEEFNDGVLFKRAVFDAILHTDEKYDIVMDNFGFSVFKTNVFVRPGPTTKPILQKTFNEIGLHSIAPATDLKTYVGTEAARARFYNEKLFIDR